METVNAPKRERFWGLYDTSDERWLMDCPPETNIANPAFWFGKAAVPGMLKRKRFIMASAAQGAIRRARLDSSVIPRPFYVVRKPRSRPLPLHVGEFIARVQNTYNWLDGQRDSDGRYDHSSNASCAFAQLGVALREYREAAGMLSFKDAP